MPLAPQTLLATWLLGLLSLTIFGGGLAILWAWYVGALSNPGWLAVSLGAALWTFSGRWVVLRLRRRSADEPRRARGGLVDRLERLDGTSLHVELSGPVDGPPIVLTHGGGTNATAWYYQKRRLAERFRLIVWDLPGHGRSRGPANHDYRLEKLARDLDDVIALAGGRPAILVGHGLGGTIALAYCARFPEKVGREVAGLVLLGTPPASPPSSSRSSAGSSPTTASARALMVIERAALVPLLYLTIWLSPLVRLMSWLGYHNGLLHLHAMRSGFAGTESRGQLDFAASFAPLASPAVQARALLALRHSDVMDALARMDVPTLVLTGDRDRLVAAEAARALTSGLPSATGVALRPGGHLAFLEQHDQVARAIALFAAEHGAVELRRTSRRGR